MLNQRFYAIGLAIALSLGSSVNSYADTASSITMENCGAYLFEWRPVDCGNGHAFAILAGGDSIQSSDVILNRGYDYAFTFNPASPRPWGQVPDLVNVNGVWGIPDNWPVLPEGSQPVTRLTLVTNNKNMSTNERYVDIVHLPNGVSAADLPAEVRKYLINVDGSDAGAYDGTETSGWTKNEQGQWMYRKPDGSYASNSWISIDEKTYYIDVNGVMLSDTITPDGVYVNHSGEKTAYLPGWMQVDGEWRYVQKNGYYAASAWIQDADGKWYYFDMGSKLISDRLTPDGFFVGPDGAWDGKPSQAGFNGQSEPGPGASAGNKTEAWEKNGNIWKYKLAAGGYVTNSWKQDTDGRWYYFDESSQMVTDTTTPDGHYVGSDGVWNGQALAE